MLSDFDLLLSRFISVPKTYGGFTAGSLAAGMVRGMLASAGFPARCVDVDQWKLLAAKDMHAAFWQGLQAWSLWGSIDHWYWLFALAIDGTILPRWWMLGQRWVGSSAG
eukprot:990382-Pelagomonas_calceolata.AAC.3